jgi:hypothetical protein
MFYKNMGRKVVMFKGTNIIKKITKHSSFSNNHSDEHTSELVHVLQFITHKTDSERRARTNMHLNKYYPCVRI